MKLLFVTLAVIASLVPAGAQTAQTAPAAPAAATAAGNIETGKKLG